MLALTISSLGCARQLSVSRAASLAKDPAEVQRRKELIDAFLQNRVRFIEVDALGCYGSCSQYVARFSADGHATFHDLQPACDETAVASVDFAHVVEAARTGGAEELLRRYEIVAVDGFAARITISTPSKTYISDGPDRTSWGRPFVTTFTRLDQIVRDTNWRPRIALENCAIGHRLVKHDLPMQKQR